jgi:hypothetical protein
MAYKQSLIPAKLREHSLVGKPFRKLDTFLLQRSYWFRDRWIDNRASERQFRGNPPNLSDAQKKVVADLRKDGLSIISFEELVGDADLWKTLADDIGEFVRETEEALRASGGAIVKKRDYLLRRYHDSKKQFGLDDPWLQLGLSFADIANEYLGMWSKLAYIDQWYTRVGGEDRERIASQRWHRDPEDRKLIKVFMYFSDVDEGAGPFEYISGSGLGGRYESLWPWKPSISVYPPPEELEAQVPAALRKTCTGPAGTIVFCNTAGFHRGGFCKSKPRILAHWKYLSPAALASYEKRLCRFASLAQDGDLSPAGRFAIH